MRNLFLYYIAILLPLGIVVYFYLTDYLGFTAFLILIIAYLLIYRTWVDGSRLASKGIIDKKDRWRMMLPGMHMKHFTELYLR